MILNVHSQANRLLVSLISLICLAGFAIRAQGQQQQSPPIWDRSGIPPTQATGGQTISADKAGPEVRWERYGSRSEEFSALLPAPPLRFYILRPQKMFEKRKGGRLYTAYADGTVYIILSLDNPKHKESLGVFIGEFQEYPLFHPNASFEREVTLGGFKGQQYRVGGGTTRNVRGIVQFYLAKDHVYVIEVMSEKIDAPSVNRFLSSLTLDGKTKGKEIMELSGTDAPPTVTKAPDQSSGSGADKGVEQPKVMTPKEVTYKAFIVLKPEPGYTEEARKKQISGTVTLRAVLSSSGAVTSIRPVSTLPYGLTEKAIAAARNIRFIPAVKDGRYVSQYVTIEYNFNIY
jgi:TonB family protein